MVIWTCAFKLECLIRIQVDWPCQLAADQQEGSRPAAPYLLCEAPATGTGSELQLQVAHLGAIN